MKAQIITPKCVFECEMVTGLDAGLESKEIRRIYDESIYIKIKSQYKFISLSDFRNASGQTIGEFMLEHHEDFAFALAKKFDEEERSRRF